MKHWQLLAATSILAIACAGPALAQSATPSAAQTAASSAGTVTLTPEAAAGQAPGGALPTVEVVATTPLGTGTSALNVPSETQIITGQEIENLNQTTLQDVLARQTPGVSVTDSQGSPLYESVDFRGETATPVSGTPEGLAVYMNGVRINESYGDIVNWDLIPPSAIDNAQIVTGNPVFGLNALAGAVVMKMKNGFTWQGTEINLQGGMDYTGQGYAEYGVNKGDWSYYVDIDGIGTNGFRYFGQSDAERAYGDVGFRSQSNEIHLSATGGASGVGIAGTTPLQLAQENPWAVFTTPQTTRLAAEMITLSDEAHITPTLTFNGDAYFRSYAEAHHDGNISAFFSCGTPYACDAPGNPLSPTNPNVTPANGLTPLPDPLGGNPADNGQPLGETDSNWTRTLSTGATAQLTDTDKIFGHANTITGGVSIDQGWSHFTGSSILSTLPANFVVPWTDEGIIEPGDDVSPTDVHATNTYLGVYVLDDFNITDRLILHAGARFNDAQIDLENTLGGEAGAVSQAYGTYGLLNSSNNYSRINPVAGLTYLITPDISIYGSYSEANRAPTPLELGCSNALLPCQIDNFLTADPPLQQVVSRTFEAGLKGSNAVAWSWAPGRLDWSVAGYRTVNSNDIYPAYSTLYNTGYYQNIGDTLREGVDIGATYTADRWDAYASYSYIKAEFLSPFIESSPSNPTADANGNIYVEPGDNLPGIPNHKFKLGFDYEVLPKWKVGADVVYRSSQYYFGAENNTLGGLNPLVSGYATLDLRTSYQVTKNIQVYGLINNALDYRGATYGLLYPTSSTENQITGLCTTGLFCSSDPRAITIAPPLEAFVGVKITFDAPPPAPPLLAKY